MHPVQPLRELTLQYIDTCEYKVPQHRSHETMTEEYEAFGFVLKGAVQVTLTAGQQQRTAKISFGDVFFLPSSSLCTIRNKEKQPAQVILIRFLTSMRPAGAGTASLFGAFLPQKDLKLHRFRMPRIYSWIQDLWNEGLQQQEPSQYFQVQSYLYAIAAECMSAAGKPSVTDDHLIDYVHQVKQQMVEHCGAPMDVEEMARLSGASYTRFYQVFKKHTGHSPLQYMTVARMNKALRLLANGPSSVTEVAHAVGYPDELYFSRLFKKHMGLSPTEYAACAKTRVANLCPVFGGDFKVLGLSPVLELQREWYTDSNKDKYYKQIEQCKPDLIFTAPVAEDVYRILSQIAPVVMIQWKGYSWKKRLQQIGSRLGIPTVAERWLAYFQVKVEHARGHLQRHLGEEPFLVVSALKPFYRVYGLQRMKVKDLFYDELRVKPPAAAEQITFWDVDSLADIASLDCGNILILAPASLPDEHCIRMEEEWLQLKRSRRQKHCIFIRHEEPLLYNASFYEGLMDQFVDHFIG
ncbi:helix-turn-helix domain-containing protein [Paenibacillus rigui]|uniref:HTH araC/xylS-type domain-containing protein n=1 Tax=Paenibacillus rigui TaxID=554312 RepID=A0A229UN80_9BACL|nr:helix-turn-helix domain-containing protein [Paenibacillus rigui]OXM84832.1 hypothetical protein CF651_18155 [Paenibacillus rigui]